jgi:hypothetical protein
MLLSMLYRAILLSALAAGGDLPNPVGEIYWVPTLEQGLAMARATGRPLFLMGYSLVGNGTTYTKLGDDCASGVF